MLIYHFLLALIMAVIVMPKSPSSLDELSSKVYAEYHQDPTYILRIDGTTYTLDKESHRLINARWIDDLELISPDVLPDNESVEGELIFRLHFKKRKKDNLRKVLRQHPGTLKAAHQDRYSRK